MTSTVIRPVRKGDTGDASCEQLVMVNLSAQPCTAWVNAVREAGQPWDGEIVDSLAKTKTLLQAKPDAHVLICYDTPESQIANEIGSGRAPSQALVNWQSEVEALLALYRQHYRRITLVAQKLLHSKSQALFQQLAIRSGIALEHITVQQSNQAIKVNQQPQVVHRLLALQALVLPPAKRLAQELEASSLPLGDSVALLDMLDETFDLLYGSSTDKTEANREEYEPLQKQLQDVQQENRLLIEQLHLVQRELEQYSLGHQSDTQKFESEIKGKNEKLHDLAQKNKSLMTQLKVAKQELKALRSSKSWKVTAPLRKVMKLLSGKKGGAA